MTTYVLGRARTGPERRYERGTPVTVHSMDHEAGTAQIRTSCTTGPDADLAVRIRDLLTPEQLLSQKMAEVHWSVACSGNGDVAWFRSPVYRNHRVALRAMIRIAWDLTDAQARKVLDILAFYGPYESLQGTEGSGIPSFVQYVREHRGQDYQPY